MKRYLRLLDAMFREMVLAKDVTKTAKYYSKDFVLFANGTQMGYEAYYALHEKLYATPIQYEYRIDEETVVEDETGIAARVHITTRMPEEPPKPIEVVMVAKYKDDLLWRLWEVTWPDWTKEKEFQ